MSWSSKVTSTTESEDDSSAYSSVDPRSRMMLSSALQSFRMASVRRGLSTAGDDEAPTDDNGITEDPIDCDELLRALDECELELIECKKGLKKARRKNKELIEDFAEQRRYFSDLEDAYAEIKLELAQAKTNDDTLLAATQLALADRDVKIMDLMQDRDQLVAELKHTTKQRNELEQKSSVLEECLAAKEVAYLTIVADNESLKQELKRLKRELEDAHDRWEVEVLDMPHHSSTETHPKPLPLPPPPPPAPPAKVSIVSRWTKGFRNPLRRRSAVTPQHADERSVARTEDSQSAPSEDDFFQ